MGEDQEPAIQLSALRLLYNALVRLAFFRVHRFIVGVHGAAFRPVVLLRMMLTISPVGNHRKVCMAPKGVLASACGTTGLRRQRFHVSGAAGGTVILLGARQLFDR